VNSVQYSVPKAGESQRDSVLQPKVGAARLPWVGASDGPQPQRGCGQRAPGRGRNPVGVVLSFRDVTQGSLRQPWAGGRNAVGVLTPKSFARVCRLHEGRELDTELREQGMNK